MLKFLIFAVVILCIFQYSFAIKCGDGYRCFEKDGIVWTMKESGNVNGPSCSSVCSATDSFCEATGDLYNCENDTPLFNSVEEFEEVAAGLGFKCKQKSLCWDGEAPGQGMVMVSKDPTDGEDGEERNCYFPGDPDELAICDTNPGNANCFGKRYATICPCTKRTMKTMCQWRSDSYFPQTATFDLGDVAHSQNGTTCLERINFYRKLAMEEGWAEVPRCGLPPVSECIDCHACASSQAEYDWKNGAHKSFKRCGESVQGVGGGKTCADVIDAFVSERNEGNDWKCNGHCGPIVKAGCFAFHWGKAKSSNTHVLNWRSCNSDKCFDYCKENEDDDANECFLTEEEKDLCYPITKPEDDCDIEYPCDGECCDDGDCCDDDECCDSTFDFDTCPDDDDDGGDGSGTTTLVISSIFSSIVIGMISIIY